MNFIILGDPIACQRARAGRQGFYDPQSSEKKSWKWVFANQMRVNGDRTIQEGPIRVDIYAHMPIPKSLSKKIKEGNLHTKKPDTDNIAKIYLDIMNGIVYEDDRLISILCIKKCYSQNPRTEIEVIELKEMNE